MNFSTLFSSKTGKRACWLIAILSTFFIIAFQQKRSVSFVPAAQCAIKAVIFDVGDVLVTTSKSSKFTTVTPTILTNPTLIYHIIGMDIKTTLFAMLSKVPAQTTQVMYHQAKPMPQIMVDFMTGRPSYDVITTVEQHINKSNYPNAMKNLFLSITKLMFNPTKLAESQQLIDTTVSLVQLLKKHGYKLYILSNWDESSFTILKKKHHFLFNLFDGIMISGQEKMGKPDLQFYTKLIKQYNLTSTECLFIDDEIYNINAAKNLGIKTILYTNESSLYEHLANFGLVKLQ